MTRCHSLPAAASRESPVPRRPAPGGHSSAAARPSEPSMGLRRPRSPAPRRARHRGSAGPAREPRPCRASPGRRPSPAGAEPTGRERVCSVTPGAPARSERRQPSTGWAAAARRSPPCPGSSQSPSWPRAGRHSRSPPGAPRAALTARTGPHRPGRAAPTDGIQTPTSAPCRKRRPPRPAPLGPGRPGGRRRASLGGFTSGNKTRGFCRKAIFFFKFLLKFCLLQLVLKGPKLSQCKAAVLTVSLRKAAMKWSFSIKLCI